MSHLQFLDCLDMIAGKTRAQLPAVVARVAAAGGPSASGTTAAEFVRFHDDLSTYTGRSLACLLDWACSLTIRHGTCDTGRSSGSALQRPFAFSQISVVWLPHRLGRVQLLGGPCRVHGGPSASP